MHAVGCPPRGFPDEPAYEEAAVEAWVDEMLDDCAAFADRFIGLDCADFPCLVYIEPVHVEQDMFHQPQDGWQDEVLCDHIDSPDLRPIAPEMGAHRGALPLAVTPPSAYDHELGLRVFRRVVNHLMPKAEPE